MFPRPAGRRRHAARQSRVAQRALQGYNLTPSPNVVNEPYFESTVKLLCLITIAGDWWDPKGAGLGRQEMNPLSTRLAARIAEQGPDLVCRVSAQAALYDREHGYYASRARRDRTRRRLLYECQCGAALWLPAHEAVRGNVATPRPGRRASRWSSRERIAGILRHDVLYRSAAARAGVL